MSEMVKITIRLPKDLVLLAKMHAMALDDDLQDFVGRELREALERKPFPAALAAMTMKRRGKKRTKQ
jgi:hypothetical protein